MTFRQPVIYLFGSRHTSNINSDQLIENDTIQDFYLSKKQQETVEYLK
ncbi:unnamed protein product, partial [Rotaria sp. Silwood1]